MVDRIATFTQSGAMSRELLRLQTEYAKTSLQQSSSLKSQDYQGISKDSFKLLQLQSSFDKITAQSENAQTALDRVNAMYTSVSSISDLIANMSSQISSAISGADGGTIADTASNALNELTSLLNTQVAGRYLFGGTVTDAAPVDTSSLATITTPSTADTSYYQGDGTIASVKASDSLTVSYGVTADNPAFEKVIRALQLVINNPTDNTALKEASGLLTTATTAVSNIGASLSSKASTLDMKISENSDDMNLIDSMISNIKDSDLAEVSVKITELSTQLEAAYSISSKLLNLKLTDYLN